MTELKTANQLYLPSDGCMCARQFEAMAIKWVRHYKRQANNCSEGYFVGVQAYLCYKAKAKAIMDLFNLKEMDVRIR